MTAGKVTKALGGRWHGTNGTACCPAHDDKNPSLSITEHDGTLLVHGEIVELVVLAESPDQLEAGVARRANVRARIWRSTVWLETARVDYSDSRHCIPLLIS